MAGYRAAIDFGTSYTVATSQAGSAATPTVLALVDEGRLSSAVALDDAGRTQAGPPVEEVAERAPGRVERTPKRCLDQPDVMLDGRAILTVDLVAALLGYVRAEMLRHFNGRAPDELCLTHPAVWEAGDPRTQRLEDAARQAGFAGLRLLPEPCAAAMALAAAGQLNQVGEGELVAVYDLGGGTFDIALLNRVPGRGFELTGEPGGDQELGGEWVDDRLYERLSSQLPADDERALRDPGSSPNPRQWRRADFAFRQGIRRAKERLSRVVSTSITLNPPFSVDHLSLTRAELELTAMPLVTRSADRFDLFLQRNGRTPADLAAICLVGGSSRLTVVNRVIGERFGRPVVTYGDPKEVTALGALYERPAAGQPPGPNHIDGLYDDALAAYWLDQFDKAVELLQQVLAARPDYPGASAKLEQARLKQRLTASYAQACLAADAGDWEQAVAGFARAHAIDPRYRDVARRLEDARGQQQIAELRAEAGRLFEAGQWEAVIKVGDRFQALNPDAADLDDLMTSARAELAAARLAEQMAADYRAALQLLDTGAWRQAADVLEQIVQVNPRYRDSAALLARARSMADVLIPGGGPTPPPDDDVPVVIGRPQVVQTFQEYTAINSVAFGADCRWLATSATETPVAIWDTTTATLHLRLGAYAWAVMFSADGRWLITSGKRVAQIWDAATGKQLLTVSHKSSRDHAVALAPDSRWLATASPGNAVRIWDTAHGRALLTIALNETPDSFGTGYGVDGLAFSPDGRRLAAASNDKTARIWDAATGNPILTVTHDGPVSAVAFSPDGRRLATASNDKTARIWDAATGNPILTVTHDGPVSAVAFSPDGRRLATASNDKTARIWNAASGEKLAELPHKRAVRHVVFSRDGDSVATASKQSAQIWTLRAPAGG